jgi:6-pyruvoyltetrahydropterin/6-carboxytetrahydropterin synthase
MYELMVEETFAAAHALRNYLGPCENLHGHTFKVQVFLSGSRLNRLGLLVDFKEIKKELHAMVKEFDHQFLNEVKPFVDAKATIVANPTSENLAKTIFKRIKKNLAGVRKVTVWESPTAYASYY